MEYFWLNLFARAVRFPRQAVACVVWTGAAHCALAQQTVLDTVGDVLKYAVTAFRVERPWEFVELLGNSWAGRGAWVQRGRQRHTGIEGTVGWAITPGARLEGRFTGIIATGSGSEVAGWDGKQLQNIPKAGMHLRLEQDLGDLPGLSYNVALTARSAKAATSNATVWVGGYGVVDLGLTWRVPSSGPRVSLDVGVRNAADRRYWRDAGQAYSADLLFPGSARAVSVALGVGGAN